jgi:hypothetical protein
MTNRRWNRRNLLLAAGAASLGGVTGEGSTPLGAASYSEPPPTTSCAVFQNPVKSTVHAVRWAADQGKWQTVAEGKMGTDDAAVIQAAYDTIPNAGGRLFVKSGEYRLSESLRLGKSDTDVVFEKGCVLRPAAGFAGFAVEIGPAENSQRRVKRTNVYGLRIEGDRQCSGVRICHAALFNHWDWKIDFTRGPALWIDAWVIEGAFYNFTSHYGATDLESPTVWIGSRSEADDHANNLSFFNFRAIYPIGGIEISNPPNQHRTVRNLYFFGTQIHWLMESECKARYPEFLERCRAKTDLIRILSGHDIHFLGGNFQFMANRGRLAVLGGDQQVDSITLKGRFWGGGEGATHVAVVNADNLFLPCTVAITKGTAVDWGTCRPNVHQYPVVLKGEIKGTMPCVQVSPLYATACGDFGGNFVRFSPPEGREGMLLVAVDTNPSGPAKRMYVFGNAAWTCLDVKA